MNRKIQKILMSLLLMTSGALAWSCNSTAEKQNDLQTTEFGLAGTSDMLYWGDTIPYYLDRTFLSSFPGYNTVLDNPDQRMTSCCCIKSLTNHTAPTGRSSTVRSTSVRSTDMASFRQTP